MRLLNSQTLELEEFLNHKDVTYAILSHRWEKDEVLFQDIEGLTAETTPNRVKDKQGYKKIEACCAQAVHDGFDYVWIDTCCIDKRSSAELSEAINSMYRWYSDSAVCYAYLADVPSNVDAETQMEKFRRSRWFTRGWTLQELIAPFNIEFYADQWYSRGQEASLGTKQSLQTVIFQITGIPANVLETSGLTDYSIAQRMSWAAKRTTTREEDRAYSLMGLFSINMPLLYGEGNRAFIRLQEEIMKSSDDETLFAWKMEKGQPALHQGLLAMSLDDFSSRSNIIKTVHDQRRIPFAVTNKGLYLEVMLSKASSIREAFSLKNEYSQFDLLSVAVLNASEVSSQNLIGILLRCFSEPPIANPRGRFVRLHPKVLLSINPTSYSALESDRTAIFAQLGEYSNPNAVEFDLVTRRTMQEGQYRTVWLKTAPNNFRLVESWPRDNWMEMRRGMLLPNLDIEIHGEAFRSAALLFSNGLYAFIVCFGYSFFSFWLCVKDWPSREYLGENFRAAEYEPSLPYLDRLTYTLHSGTSVSASFRRQRLEERPCYVLYISVQDHHSVT